MKKFLLASAALVGFTAATSASAADLAARPYTKAPPIIAAVYDWSGFYIGGNGGYGWSDKCWSQFSPGTATYFADGCHDASGGTAGGQIGYRWQSASWVFGLEAQGNWADFSASNVATLIPRLSNRSKIDAFGLFTGQIGYAWNNTLLYVKGGAAVTSDKYEGLINFNGLVYDSSKETRWGGAVGVGLEYGFTPNWSFAVEYDHLFMGEGSVDFYSTTVANQFSRTDRVKQDVDVVTARINYKWGGPVIAKY